MIFQNRSDAGERLARRLERFRGQKPLVLGVPRGAVPMAKIIAERLGGELDLILVHKFGHPMNPEYALGSVTEEGDVFLGLGAQRMGLNEDDIIDAAQREIRLLREKRQLLTPGREAVPVRGRTVIIVDDGIATGATMTAAVRSVREKEAARIVVATPVASNEAIHRLESEGAEVEAELVPDQFWAVSQFYADFSQVEDQDVARAMSSPTGAGRG